MGNLVKRPGNSADAAEIPVVRDNDVVIGQGARPEKASAAARRSQSPARTHLILTEKPMGIPTADPPTDPLKAGQTLIRVPRPSGPLPDSKTAGS